MMIESECTSEFLTINGLGSARNMIGQSQSGTGKTAAFVLTMLSRVDYASEKPQAIALARE